MNSSKLPFLNLANTMTQIVAFITFTTHQHAARTAYLGRLSSYRLPWRAAHPGCYSNQLHRHECNTQSTFFLMEGGVEWARISCSLGMEWKTLTHPNNIHTQLNKQQAHIPIIAYSSHSQGSASRAADGDPTTCSNSFFNNNSTVRPSLCVCLCV